MIRKTVLKIYSIVKQWDQKERYNTFRRKYNIHKSFRFNGESIFFYGEGELVGGESSYIGGFSTIQVERDCKVVIGKNCRISHNVRIYTSSVIPDQDFANHNNLRKKMGNVTIGDNVWIGVNVFINPGINIGENSVIGANAVVTKDIPPFAICGGVPAKVIRYKTIDA